MGQYAEQQLWKDKNYKTVEHATSRFQLSPYPTSTVDDNDDIVYIPKSISLYESHFLESERAFRNSSRKIKCSWKKMPTFAVFPTSHSVPTKHNVKESLD